MKLSEDIVNKEDLIDLTGSTRPNKQAEVLKRCGIKYIVRVDGKIRTTWSAVNSALYYQKNHEQPNLDFLNGT